MSVHDWLTVALFAGVVLAWVWFVLIGWPVSDELGDRTPSELRRLGELGRRMVDDNLASRPVSDEPGEDR